MQDLSKYLNKWRKGRLFNFAELDFHNRDFGQYFEINCLVRGFFKGNFLGFKLGVVKFMNLISF